jgi:hypothetical protein
MLVSKNPTFQSQLFKIIILFALYQKTTVCLLLVASLLLGTTSASCQGGMCCV